MSEFTESEGSPVKTEPLQDPKTEVSDPLTEFTAPTPVEEGNMDAALRGDDAEEGNSAKFDFDDNSWDEAGSDDDDGIVIVTDGGCGDNGAKRGYERGANRYVRPEIPKDLVKATANLGAPGGPTDLDQSVDHSDPGAEDPLQALRFPMVGTYYRTAFDVDLSSMDSTGAPWRQNRVDLSNFFNYGLSEATWKKYAEKQLRIRAERGEGPQATPASNAAPLSAAALVASIHAATAAPGGTTARAAPVEVRPRPIPPPVQGGTLAPYTQPAVPGAMPKFIPPAGAPPGQHGSRFAPAGQPTHPGMHMQMNPNMQMQMNPNMQMHPGMQMQMQMMHQNMQMQNPNMRNPNFQQQGQGQGQGHGQGHGGYQGQQQGNSRKRPLQ